MDHASRVLIQFLKRKCTNIAKIIAKFLKYRVNDPGLAFAGKVDLGPFWTLVQALSYEHVLRLFVSTFVSSFRHERYRQEDLHEDAHARFN
jgi:hypothetical protein